LLLLAALVICWSPLASAALLFHDYQPEAGSGPDATTNGSEFTVGSQPVSVTRLGVYAGFGLMQESYVGIWRVSDEALLGSTTVAPGAFTQIENWYFVNVSPFTLAADTTYRIGTQNLGSDMGWGGTFNVGSGIASVAPGSVSTFPLEFDPLEGPPLDVFSFKYPAVYWPDDAMLAANFEFVTVPVPEPAEWTMLIAGILVIAFIARRRRMFA
jgi:hypothetical protein